MQTSVSGLSVSKLLLDNCKNVFFLVLCACVVPCSERSPYELGKDDG